jgi:hypothetical protein
MRNKTDVTPAEAKAVWESLGKPSSRKVSLLLAAHGRMVSSQTVARWRSAGWPSVASRTRDGLDNSIAAVIGKPNATVGDLPPVAPFAPDLPIIQALEETCRDGLNAARTVFRLIGTDPALIRSMPVAIGVMLEKTGTLVARLAEALGGRDAILERGMKDVSAGQGRTRENDPLAEAIERWDKGRHPPSGIAGATLHQFRRPSED